MTYRSPYSSRSRGRPAPLWPKILGGLLVVLVLVTAAVAFFVASGLEFSVSRKGETPVAGNATGTVPAAAAPGTSPAAAPTPLAGNSGGAGALPPTAVPLGGTPAAGGTPGRPGGTPSGPLNLNDSRSVAQAYVDRWNAKDYSGMYDLIGASEQGNLPRDKFTARYGAIAEEAGLSEVKATLGAGQSGASKFSMRVEIQSSLVGPITEDNTITLRQEADGWRVAWTPSLIFKDLGDGLIRFRPDVPTRGRILDRKGRPLAQQGLVTQIGIIPQDIKDEPALLAGLSKALSIAPEKIKAQYAGAQPNWFVPIKIMPEVLPADMAAALQGLPGVAARKVPERTYPQGALGAHVVGYVGEINADELKTLAARGYIAGDRIGRSGVESWGEEFLAGKKGGQLTVVGPNEAVRTVIAERKSEPAGDITLTLDIDIQRALEEALGDRPSSGVILDPATGGVVAMASHPTYDPNGFILGFSPADWARLNDETLRPLWNRATQFTYPSGSIFKVVTASAATEKLGLKPESTIPCPAEYSIPGAPNVWRDWTYPNAQGTLTLQNAITQSCNTVFYEIGKRLDDIDAYALPEMARSFGLGKPTGLEELPEAAGTVPDPKWKRETLNDGWATGDAINLAIGQGFFLATPLQMANLYNAIANRGAILRPFLAAKITAPDGRVLRVTERKEWGKLPIAATTMQMIHTAMINVTTAANGTAVPPFQGSPILVAGKTGTAQVPPKEDHGWFASFAPGDAPKITVLAMVENGGPGSKVAAPIGRHVYDVYATLGP